MYYSYVEIEYVATSFSPARMDLALKLLNEVELIHFVCSNSKCIRLNLTKTNTNALHSNPIHSISRKNLTILRKSNVWRRLYLFFQVVIIIPTNGHRQLDLFFQVVIM
jgi:hypothetical protein